MIVRRRSRPHLSLTGQLLVFQLSLVTVVLIAVSVTSIQQSRLTFEREEGRRLLTVAEYSAAVPVLRFMLEDEASGAQLAPPVESLRATTGVSSLIVTDAAGKVLASPDDPRRLGSTVLVPDSAAAQNRGWSGTAHVGLSDLLLARSPVLGDDGELVGIVIAATPYPTIGQTLASSGPDLLTFLAVAGALGIIGSVWLARRMKRQTLGLEPVEIARLVEHREAMVHGIREGVVAVDGDGRITLANDSATRLLGLPEDTAGKRLDEVGLEPAAIRALSQDGIDGVDMLLIHRGALLALNQVSIHPRGARREIVTTLRDRTELVALQHELGTSQQSTDTLRAQTHEFANRLHTIGMLIQLGEADVAANYISALSRDNSESHGAVLRRIEDPTVAAVIIAKMSVARERGATLELTKDSSLTRVEDELAADVVTVIGNLIDNALDAVVGRPNGKAELTVRPLGPESADGVYVSVHDSGDGIPDELLDSLFEPRVSSKGRDGERGFGLAIVSLAATRRGGTVRARNADGAVFEVELPRGEVAHA